MELTPNQTAILQAMKNLGADSDAVSVTSISGKTGLSPTLVGRLLRKIPSCVTRIGTKGSRLLWRLRAEAA